MSQLPKLNPNPLDDLFSTEEERADSTVKIYQIACSELDAFKNHPYKVLNDEKMAELIDSIKDSGIITPLIIRPSENGRYEIISGHRRKYAAIKAGLSELPCVIRNLSDSEATILMVDSNSQREEILPSEKAFAYKMKLEAMSHQGKRTDLTSDQLGPKSVRSNEKLAEEVKESVSNIKRYIRLTELIKPLLDMVDDKRIAFLPAVELSYLSEDNQYVLLDCIEANEATPSHAQAIHLKKLSQEGKLTATKIEEVMSQLKPNQKPHLSLSLDKFSKYFPPNTSTKKIEEEIFNALDFYKASINKNEVIKSHLSK